MKIGDFQHLPRFLSIREARFGVEVLLHFCTPLLLLMTHEKNAAESFTVALTLTLGGTKVQYLAPGVETTDLLQTFVMYLNLSHL